MFKNLKVKKIIDTQEGQTALLSIWEILYPVFDKNVKLLTRQEMEFCLVEFLESEVNSGGFDSFFSYSYGDYYYETIDALDKIGAYKFKAVLQKAESLFPDGKVPKNRSEREDEIFDNDRYSSEFSKLDDEFYATYQKEDITSMLLTYVKENIDHFR